MTQRISTRPSSVDEFVTAILTASRVLISVSAQSLAEVEDTVTLTQFRTMVVLANDGDSTLSRLADTLGVNASTAMRTIDRLLAAGLATRVENPINRREVVLGLTRAGAKLVHDVTERRRAALAGIVRRMPAARRAELVSALTEFAAAAGEPPAPTIGW